MPVITIRGQVGSGSPQIGRQVAERLHLDYVDREIIAKVAHRLRWSPRGVEEKEIPVGSLLDRIVTAVGGLHPFVDVGLPASEIPLDDAHYIMGLESVIKELAESRAVIIRGRGSQFILKDYPGALHVLVIAPIDIRVKRFMESRKLDEESARTEIERLDNARREFTNKYFQAEPEDPANYDLVINTRDFTFDAAASIVIGAVPFKEKIIK